MTAIRGACRSLLAFASVVALLAAVLVWAPPDDIRTAGGKPVQIDKLAVPATDAAERRSLKAPGIAAEHAGADTVVAQLAPHETDPFTILGVTWEAGLDPAGVFVEARWKSAGKWSEWTELHIEADLAAEGTPATEPLWVGEDGPSTAAAVRVSSHSSATPSGVQLVTIDPGESVDVEPSAQTLATPEIVRRATWGASGASCDTPVFAELAKGAVVHHTVGSNSYTTAESAGIVRGIQSYHQDARGWCDIGYNFLVDKFGRVFEGREGGVNMPVRGAHAGNFDVNMEAAGVSLMGTFSTTTPSAAMKAATVKIIAWRFADWGIPAKGTYTSGGVTLNRIAGHRNVKSTECPGQKAYDWIGTGSGLRDRVAATLAVIANDRFDRPQYLKVVKRELTELGLQWAPVSGASHYAVSYSVTGAASPTVKVVGSTGVTLTGLTKGKRYYATVRPTTSAGSPLGPAAAIVTTTTLDNSPPTNLRATYRYPTKMKWEWSGVSGASSYQIEFSSLSSFEYARTMTVPGGSAVFETLKPATVYYARVRALGAGGVPLTTFSKTAAAATALTPGPTDLDETYRYPTALRWKWSAVSGATRYKLEVSSYSDFRYVRTVYVSENTGAFTNLSRGTKYYARVRAVSSAGASTSTLSNIDAAYTKP